VDKLNIMKNILFTLALLISLNSFGQALSPNQMGMKEKTYKKIAKKLDLKIINRGYNGETLNLETANKMVNYAMMKGNLNGTAYDYIKLWRDVFFELGIGLNNDANWTFRIDTGGFTGIILKNNSMVVKFTTKQKMYLKYSNPKRKDEFVQIAKVVFNEILKSAR